MTKETKRKSVTLYTQDTLIMRKRHSQTYGLAHVVCYANDSTADNRPYRLQATEWLSYSRDRLLSY